MKLVIDLATIVLVIVVVAVLFEGSNSNVDLASTGPIYNELANSLGNRGLTFTFLL